MFSGSNSYSRDATLQPCDRITDSSFDRVIPRAQCGQIACPSMQQWRLMCPCLSLLTGIKRVVRDCHNQQWPAVAFRLTALPAFGDAWTSALDLHGGRAPRRVESMWHLRTLPNQASIRAPMNGNASLGARHLAIFSTTVVDSRINYLSGGLPTGLSTVGGALLAARPRAINHAYG
jgi:hypothetical protein